LFKERNGLKEMKRHREAASSHVDAVKAERKRIQDIIKKSEYQPCNIYNMDEIGLFYGYASAV
jgi:hypothetical protein